jgi:erythromycin esterase-like protein
VVAQLAELCRRRLDAAAGDPDSPEGQYVAEQNARVVVSAEQYYRAMFRPGHDSWNLRDRHMAEVLDALARFLERDGRPARVVVWAHNSHVGDARATEMGQQGQLTLGQLVREEAGADAVLVGFTTATGSVTAASDWDGDAERKRVRPPLPGSVEALLHAAPHPNLYLDLREGVAAEALRAPRLERAIGVIYRPESERLSHYFLAAPSRQFDALLHYDTTRAVEPLSRSPAWEAGERELPETYPSAL